MWELLAIAYCEYKKDPESEYKHGRYQGALAMYRSFTSIPHDTIKANLYLYWRNQCAVSVTSSPSVS